jgi:hypothetical protein
LSPFITLPTVFYIVSLDPGYELICGGIYRNCNYSLAIRVSTLIAILGSALWHLVLLKPATNKELAFVRWHGRQALLLAGIRTVVPFGFFLFFGEDFTSLIAIPVLIAIWLFGTLWAQSQAKRGECSLARWFGQDVNLPLPPPDRDMLSRPAVDRPLTLADLIEIIQHNPDREKGKRAVGELKKRGLVAAAFGGAAGSGRGEPQNPAAVAAVEVIRYSNVLGERDKALRELKRMDGLIEQL